MNVENLGRYGALTSVRVSGSADELSAAKALASGRAFLTGRDTITGNVNKSELSALRQLEQRAIAATVAAAPRARQLMLLRTAERLGLPHGRSWICSARDADMGDSSFEGELVCYVYED